MTGAILFWSKLALNKQVLITKEKIKQTKLEIPIYKAKVEHIAKIKKNIGVLEQKLEIISLLKKQREKQLVLFDGMTRFVVLERMWLESLQTNKTKVMIKGIAFDNTAIADFMEKLEKSLLFSKVDLKTAKTKKIKEDLVLKSFELFCRKQESEMNLQTRQENE